MLHEEFRKEQKEISAFLKALVDSSLTMFLFVNLDQQAESKEDPFSGTKYSQSLTHVTVENQELKRSLETHREKCHYFLQLSQLLELNGQSLQFMISKTVLFEPFTLLSVGINHQNFVFCGHW